MARFVIRSLVSTAVTMLLVSITLFFLLEVGSGDVAIKILGIESSPEQRASLRAQLGLHQSAWLRYLDWLAGNDWRVAGNSIYPLLAISNPQTGELEWWNDVEGTLIRWKLVDGDLLALQRQADGSTVETLANDEWVTSEDEAAIFWGVNTSNSLVKWVRGKGKQVFVPTASGTRVEGNGPVIYIPLRKGLLRGDAGMSLETRRPVAVTLVGRLRNTAILAGVAFMVIMPLALLFGILAGINEGRFLDRFISITSLTATAIPEFVTGIFLILIFGIWLRVLPSTTVFLSDDAIFQNPTMLVLPVLTLTAVELGYVIRMTRASMVEVMNSPYIRTAILKGLPYWQVVARHAVRNALMAPVTVIMLHVNWLVGGVVVVEVIFGFPGLGKYIYDAAIFGDFNAVEAAAMFTVALAVATRLIGDLIYTFLNPRIRYA